MGFTPREAGAMTLWEWQCAVKGWNLAHGGKPETQYPSDEEFELALSMVKH